MKIDDLSEAKNYLASPIETIKINCDRNSSGDVARAILPALVKIAYANLASAADKHDKDVSGITATVLDFEVDDEVAVLANALSSSEIKKAVEAFLSDKTQLLNND